MENLLKKAFAFFDRKITDYQIYVDRRLQTQENKLKTFNNYLMSELENINNPTVKKFNEIAVLRNQSSGFEVAFPNGVNEIYIKNVYLSAGKTMNIFFDFNDGDTVMFQYTTTNDSAYIYFKNDGAFLSLNIQEYNIGTGNVKYILPMFMTTDGMGMSSKNEFNNPQKIYKLRATYSGTCSPTIYAR